MQDIVVTGVDLLEWKSRDLSSITNKGSYLPPSHGTGNPPGGEYPQDWDKMALSPVTEHPEGTSLDPTKQAGGRLPDPTFSWPDQFLDLRGLLASVKLPFLLEDRPYLLLKLYKYLIPRQSTVSV